MYIFDDTTTLSFTDDTLKAKIAVFQKKISHHLWTVMDITIAKYDLIFDNRCFDIFHFFALFDKKYF